jgi:exonuclease SbcC
VIPRLLALRNFMSFGDASPALDLTGLHVACLAGENGHGKSALLEAITWALWGQTRARSDDDLIRAGATEMTVDFEFVLGSDTYRVQRKRTVRASGQRRVSTPVLEFQIASEHGWRPLTGDSIRATQGLIDRVLRIDYDTFVHSAYLAQGHADAFTLKPPAERKRLLAELLGLGRYDELEKSAREVSRAAQADRQRLQLAIDEFDRQIETRAALETDLAAAQNSASLAETRHALAVAELRAAEAELHVARADQAEQTRLEQQRGQLERTIALEGMRLKQIATEIARHAGLIARRDEVAAGLTRLDLLRAEETRLTQMSERRAELVDQRASLAAQVASARAAIVAELAGADATGLELARRREGMTRQSRDRDRLQQEHAAFGTPEADVSELRMARERTEAESAALTESNRRLRIAMDEIQQRLAVLESADALCPVCATPLSPESQARLRRQIQDEGKALGDEFRRNRARLEVLRADVQTRVDAIGALERLIARGTALLAQISALDEALASRDSVEQECAANAELSVRLRVRLTGGDYAADEQRRIAELDATIAETVGGDALPTLRREMRQLAMLEGIAAQIEAADDALPREQARLVDAETAQTEREIERAAIVERIATLAARVAAADAAELRRRQIATEVDTAIAVLGQARERVGSATQRLAAIDALAAQRADRLHELQAAGSRREIHDELARAFGRNGIQAMIIERAIPEIEAEANDLLARLSDGQMALALETQRLARSGEGTIETLDIRIGDGYGTRAYEMFSGGEAFRVNIALRVALSKLLARRAGAQVQFLAIDEGFGSQDTAGRDRMVDAIATIAQDFEKVLVVTHIDDLRDAFPARIDVVKGPEGSVVSTPRLLGD